MKEIPITEWAKTKFSHPFAAATLYGWAKGGAIQPCPRKVGRFWMVREDAEYVGAEPISADNIDDPVVAGLLG